MRQLIAGLALTSASVFSAVVLDSCSESLYTKQHSWRVLSLEVSWWLQRRLWVEVQSTTKVTLSNTCAMKLQVDCV